MGKVFFDYDNGDYGFAFSDNMAMDMDSGGIHMISSWSMDDEDE